MMPDSDAAFYFTQVLLRCGASVVAGNSLKFMLKWRTFEQSPEGPDAQWNPLNTTRDTDENGNTLSHTDFNSAGVRNFSDEHTGVIATAATLANGLYPVLLQALLSGNFAQSAVALLSTEIRTWGTTRFANYLDANGLDEWASQSAPIPASTDVLTPDAINEALQWRFYLLRLATQSDSSLVKTAYDTLRQNSSLAGL